MDQRAAAWRSRGAADLAREIERSASDLRADLARWGGAGAAPLTAQERETVSVLRAQITALRASARRMPEGAPYLRLEIARTQADIRAITNRPGAKEARLADRSYGAAAR